MTLTEFLLARIAEDEEAALGVNRGRWNSRIAMIDGDLYGLASRQHPARVLAECEAKRRIIAIHDSIENAYSNPEWTVCDRCGSEGDSVGWPCDTLTALALPYADHPDYLAQWRP